MTREEAIRELDNMRKNPLLNPRGNAEEFDMAIEALKSQPEWISCSDGLPDMNQIVVVANKDKKTWDFGQFRSVCFIDENGRYHWNWKKNTCRIVDYWMPKDNAIRMPWKE